MATSHKRASTGGGGATERSVAVVADRVSKLYPGRPVTMFPPVLSIFQRDLFRRKRSQPSEADAAALRTRGGGLGFDLGDDDDDDDDDDYYDEDEVVASPRGRPDEDIWALKEVSFHVPAGGSLGILGGPAAGKTTLLSILGGHAFPTEGRVLVRRPVNPVPARLARGLRLAEKGTFDFNLAFGAQVVGLRGQVTKRNREEIEKLAAPLVDEHGEPVRGWTTRLAIATSVVVPANVILLEEEAVMDEAFTARVVARLQERLQAGAALVVAARTPTLVRELCDETMVLDEGKAVDQGPTRDVLRRLEVGATTVSNGARSRSKTAARGTVWQGRKLSVPEMVTPFNSWVALLSVRLDAPRRDRGNRVHTSEELAIELELETAVSNTEVRCGVDFMPADGGGACIRLEHPSPLRLAAPERRTITVRTLPGTLPGGTYQVRIDAIVWNAADRQRTVIARDAGEVQVVSEGLVEPDVGDDLVDHWDGGPCLVTSGRWSGVD